MAESFAPKVTFDEAIELLNARNPEKAVSVCRQAIEQNSKDVNMVALLGAIYLKMRRYKEAELQLRAAIKLAPSFAKPYEDLGHLLVTGRRAKEAVEVLQTATRLDPQLESAHFNLGKALAMRLLVPAPGTVDLGDLAVPEPLCGNFGFFRGTVVDRYYLDRFLDRIRHEVVGRVLEVGGRRANREAYGFTNAERYIAMDMQAHGQVDLIADERG